MFKMLQAKRDLEQQLGPKCGEMESTSPSHNMNNLEECTVSDRVNCDDDSDEEPPLRWDVIDRILGIDGVEEIDKVDFWVVGVLVYFEILRNCGKRHILISESVAKHLTSGSLPGEDLRVLQHGRLAPNQSFSYKLTLPLDVHARQDAGRWLACGKLFFNFVLKQWQPATALVTYLPRCHVLYCAFAPVDDALFVKVGYRALGNKTRESIVRYVENKTRKLRLTNRYGAGLFLMPLPESHNCFESPARAAEESLKSAVSSSPHLRANPSGSNGEFVAFSFSLEYYFVKSKGKGTALQALASTLQDFTGNRNLKPLRSVSSPGVVRAGRSRLVEWHDYKTYTKAKPSLRLPRASALLSIQKLGAFSRRMSRGIRKLSKPRLTAVKRRRKAWSCPL